MMSQPCCLCSLSVNDHRNRQHGCGSCEFAAHEKMAHCSMDEKECKFCYYLHTYFVTIYHFSRKGARWLVDALPPSPSASPLANARRCWPGSGPPLSRHDVPVEAGLSYSSLMGSPSPRLLPSSASAVALSTSGCSGFRRKAWKDWPTNLAEATGACRANLC